MFDVTLACEDETIEAHKVILSACSPFFRHVFRKTKQSHPFIYLKGVLHKDLVSLLEYIYTGETQVLAEDVERFIETGREMKVKGLAEDDVDNADTNSLLSNSVSKQDETVETPSDLSTESSTVFYKDEKKSVKSKGDAKKEDMRKVFETHEDRVQNEKLHTEILNRTEKVVDNVFGSMLKCTECGKMFKRKYHLARHVESHLEGFVHRFIGEDL